MSSRSYRNNNPGNLEYGPFAKRHGGTMEKGVKKPRFAAWSDAAKGVAALAALLSGPSYDYKTIREFVESYAPRSENNVRAYIDAICEEINRGSHTRIRDLDAYAFIHMLKAITTHEGYTP